jgi:hypothetical protein
VELAAQLEDDFGTGRSADVYSFVCFEKGRGGVLATFRGRLAAIKFEIS